MKTIVLTLCILAAGVSCALADDLAMAATIPVTVPMTTRTILGGVVKSVSWADPVKGTKSEIVVTNTEKKTLHILVTSTTTLWDADAKAIMPDGIATKRRVNVVYLTTEEGVNIAKSIKVLK